MPEGSPESFAIPETERLSLAALQRAARSLATAPDPPEIFDRLLSWALAGTGARGGAIYRLVESTATLHRERLRGWDRLATRDLEEIPLGSDNPLAAVTRTRASRTVPLDAIAAADPERASAMRAAGTGDLVLAPLVAGDRALGAAVFGFPADVPLDARAEAFLDVLAVQAAEALDRVRSASALEASERGFRDIIDAAEAGVWMIDERGRTRFVNRRVSEMLGYPPEELLGRDPFAHIDPADRAKMRRIRRERFAGMRGEDDVRMRTRNGRVMWVHGSSAPIVGPDGRVTGAVGFLTDITARKRGEERQAFLLEASRALSTSLEIEETLRSVVRLAVPAVADWCTLDLLDENGAPRNVEVAHRDPAMVETAREWRRKYPDPRNQDPAYEEMIRTGRPRFLPEIDPELLRRAAVDEEHWRLIQSLQLRSAMVLPLVARGKVIGTLTLIQAESGRRFDEDDLAAMEELARRAAIAIENARLFAAEQRTRAAVELTARRIARLQSVTAQLVSTVTAEGIAEIVLGEMLPATGAGTGMIALTSRGEPRPPLEIAAARGVSMEGAERLVGESGPLRAALGEGGPVWIGSPAERARIPALDAPAEVAAFAAIPLSLDHHAVGIVWLSWPAARAFSDEEKELLLAIARLTAQALDRARLYLEAREASERKDEFLAMLAHELRNPLAPTLTALELIRIKAAKGMPVERERETAERQIRHLARLVDDLLDVARISRGKIQLHREPTELATPIASAVDVVRPLVERRGQTLSVQVADELVVDGDPHRLEQIFSNLLQNAAKYTPEHGRIAVAATQEDGDAVIRVRDNGPGISPEMQERIFDLFVQGSRSLDRATGGLGIGLTLVRRLVDLHQGRISLVSAPGAGSEFTVRLPLRSVLRSAATPGGTDRPRHDRSSREERPPRLQRRVLVVDDNRDAADILAAALDSLGFATDVAYDGREAVRLATQTHPDAAVLDLGLPGMNGFDVARALRRDPSTRGATLIALSGYGQPRDRERSREAGIDHHLLKPVDLSTLAPLLGAPELPAAPPSP